MTISVPNPDYDDPKETCAFFGLALYYAQVLEQGVINIAVALHAKGVPGFSQEDVNSLFDSLNDKTFGQLLHSAQKAIPIPDLLAKDLGIAVKKRNHLAHRFFVEHDVDHMTPDGRRKMIDELHATIVFFQDVDKQMDELWHSTWESFGINADWWEKQVEKYKNEHGLLIYNKSS